jgi:hypothetical protein
MWNLNSEGMHIFLPSIGSNRKLIPRYTRTSSEELSMCRSFATPTGFTYAMSLTGLRGFVVEADVPKITAPDFF